MIVIPAENMMEKIQSSVSLLAGRQFIRDMIESRIVPDGICPIICGGAIRDVFFRGQEPHDVDIFLIRGTTNSNPFSGANAGLVEWERKTDMFVEDLKEFLEDSGIEYTSLLHTSADQEPYMGANGPMTMKEILQFNLGDILIQIMCNVPLQINQLHDAFPVSARGFLSEEHFFTSTHGMLAMNCTDFIPVVTDRDIRYVAKKWPAMPVVRFFNNNELYFALTWSQRQIQPTHVSQMFVGGTSRADDSSIIPVTSRDGLTTSTSNVFKSYMQERLNISREVMDTAWNRGTSGLVAANWSQHMAQVRAESTPAVEPTRASSLGRLWEQANRTAGFRRGEIQSSAGRSSGFATFDFETIEARAVAQEVSHSQEMERIRQQLRTANASVGGSTAATFSSSRFSR